jgi:hypothetical protein
MSKQPTENIPSVEVDLVTRACPSVRCPHCGKTTEGWGFMARIGRVVQCPFPECGELMMLSSSEPRAEKQ